MLDYWDNFILLELFLRPDHVTTTIRGFFISGSHSPLLVWLPDQLDLSRRHPVTKIHGNISAIHIRQVHPIFAHHAHLPYLGQFRLLLQPTWLIPWHKLHPLSQSPPYLHGDLPPLVVQHPHVVLPHVLPVTILKRGLAHNDTGSYPISSNVCLDSR